LKFIKPLLLTVALSTSLWSNSLVHELKNLSPEQQKVLEKTWELGKEFDLHYTLTAIAWQESSFGKYLVGRWSPDYGVFQININTYKRRFKKEIKGSNLSDEQVIKFLTHNYSLGFVAAVEELLFWKKVRKNDWKKVWASYNDGTVIGEKGLNYSRKLNKKIKALSVYMKGK
jgi:hypothetical protein